ncbi:hypothetical protein KIN20_018598 [Parelaphostrongylus tenuis]|uniref:Uncharacterized protein n=1 Tax=Parelaphostrongylus tenuis TaxID=148309 RepID=A0AAD5N276_PARTN|nr:hypothetical protein KIN20_018598 [Parelaphostrongylus tenuis]
MSQVQPDKATKESEAPSMRASVSGNSESEGDFTEENVGLISKTKKKGMNLERTPLLHRPMSITDSATVDFGRRLERESEEHRFFQR